jgi:Undecaprenyl-phosphate glucose phosphotransferase
MKPENFNISPAANAGTLIFDIHTTWRQRRDSLLRQLPDRPFVAPRVVVALIRLAEIALIVLVGFLNAIRYPGLEEANPFYPYGMAIATVAFASATMLQMGRLYGLPVLFNPLGHLPRFFVSWFVAVCLVALLLFATKMGASVSRSWFIVWAASGLCFFIAGRFAVAAILRQLNRHGQFNKRAVLVGGGADAEHVISTINKSSDAGITLLGIFDDRRDDRSPDVTLGLKKLGTIPDLIEFVRATRIDTLILTLPCTSEDRLTAILKCLWVLPVDIRLSAQGQKLRYRPRAYSYIGNLALLDVFDRPLGDWGPFIKTIEDKLVAFLALILLSPVFAAVALAIKLDSKGSVLFRQKRYGFNNELIEVFKFRSMYLNEADADARKLVSKDDPRVTRVGRFIRRTSLDELPQLFNVLKGELSLVGPRPHATKASAAGNLYESVVDGYFARHKVKPGITGWAQVNGWRGETDTAEKIERRVEHDLYYIENWSLAFDLYILAKTPIALLNTEHAY